MKNKFFAVISALIIAVCGLQTTALAQIQTDGETAQIIVSQAAAKRGDSGVEIAISLNNNPGFVSAKISVLFDEKALTLKKVTDCGVLGSNMHSPSYKSPYSLYWNNGTALQNFTVNGTVAVLTFDVKESAADGFYPVEVVYDEDNIVNFDLDNVYFEKVSGGVNIKNASFEETVASAKPGETVRLEENITLSKELVIPNGVTLEIALGASFDGAKVKLCEDSVVKSTDNIYGKLTADTLVGMNSSNGGFIYKASAIIPSNIVLDGVQIRTSGTQGLRFIAKLGANLNDNNYLDYGIIIAPTELSETANMTLFNNRCGKISKSELGEDFRYFEIGESYFEYTICITGIDIKNYSRKLTARPFVSYSDGGEIFTAYAEYNEKYDLSVIDVARGLSSGGDESVSHIIDEYNNYVSEK